MLNAHTSARAPFPQAHSSGPSLKVERVNVAYSEGKLALRDASLTLEHGSICGLIGLNGSGKSTLFKTIMGFLNPLSGTVTVLGRSSREAQKAGQVSYVPQSEEVDWNFPVSVWDVVLMGRYGHMNRLRIPKKQDLEIARDSLERVGMTAFKDRQIGELSGGQRKRAFLARALAQQGQVMLLDEPFGGVDATTEEVIIRLLTELKNAGHTVLISTHDLDSVRSFCDTVALIAGRTVLEYGPTEQVFTPDNLMRVFGGAASHAAS
ncbi:MAG: metal ABC transporter ATP-binding protein [Pseudopedobacter sp.]|nr:metal ABC transporter ATP-binding protein [Deinococcales bacterium]